MLHIFTPIIEASLLSSSKHEGKLTFLEEPLQGVWFLG